MGSILVCCYFLRHEYWPVQHTSLFMFKNTPYINHLPPKEGQKVLLFAFILNVYRKMWTRRKSCLTLLLCGCIGDTHTVSLKKLRKGKSQR